MTTSQRILWGRVILYGVLTEAVLTIIGRIAPATVEITGEANSNSAWAAIYMRATR